MAKSKNKYGNKKVRIDGKTFDSTKEGKYYLFLRSELMAGRIKKLELQPRYPLEVNGVLVCTYVADFRVTYHDGSKDIIDVKGYRTPVYKLKNKLMLAVWGIKIKEI